MIRPEGAHGIRASYVLEIENGRRMRILLLLQKVVSVYGGACILSSWDMSHDSKQNIARNRDMLSSMAKAWRREMKHKTKGEVKGQKQ